MRPPSARRQDHLPGAALPSRCWRTGRTRYRTRPPPAAGRPPGCRTGEPEADHDTEHGDDQQVGPGCQNGCCQPWTRAGQRPDRVQTVQPGHHRPSGGGLHVDGRTVQRDVEQAVGHSVDGQAQTQGRHVVGQGRQGQRGEGREPATITTLRVPNRRHSRANPSSVLLAPTWSFTAGIRTAQLAVANPARKK